MAVAEERAGQINANPRPGVLAGIRVIELADEQAEYCGLTLAGLGAEVIKVEPPGGNAFSRGVTVTASVRSCARTGTST